MELQRDYDSVSPTKVTDYEQCLRELIVRSVMVELDVASCVYELWLA